MTNFDPGGFLLLLTVIPSVVAGAVSITVAGLAARFGYGEYESNVVVILGALVAAWIGAAFAISTSMLLILAVTLAMVGAYAATRSVTAASIGWVVGVLLLFAAFAVASSLGIYRGVDQTGTPQGLVAQYLPAFYAVGLFVCGAIGGKAVQSTGPLLEHLRDR